MAKPNNTTPNAKPAVKVVNADDKPKKEKVARTMHPAVAAALQSKDARITAMPADFDPKKHKRVPRKAWKDDSFYFDRLADEAMLKVTKLRTEAENCRKLGNTSDRVAAKKLQRMSAKMAELKAQLEAAGVDVSKLMAGAE